MYFLERGVGKGWTGKTSTPTRMKENLVKIIRLLPRRYQYIFVEDTQKLTIFKNYPPAAPIGIAGGIYFH